MILLLQLFALYTLHCYAAYSLLLPPYDPPPTALSLYTLVCYAAYSLLIPPYDPPPTALPSIRHRFYRCTNETIWSGGGGRGGQIHIGKNTKYASSSTGLLADIAADAAYLHSMPRGFHSEVEK